MPSTRNILTAFIASPGDVNEERKAAREIVERLNDALKSINWQIELLGWEDTLPGAGRPQELINKDLDLCELFIGILWKRWGTKTGKYSSGFEEEFERARKRRKTTDSPEMWLAFKDVDRDSINDPGEQLKKVLDFKNQQIKNREVLFKTFADTEDWKEQLHSWLLKHVLGLYQVSTLAESIENTAKPNKTVDSRETLQLKEYIVSEYTESQSEIQDSANVNPANEQLINAASALIEVLNHKLSDQDSEEKSFNLLDATRIQLYATAITSEKYTAERLDVHTANLLYKEKESLSLTEAESHLILRSIVGDENETVPGWYWFSYLGTQELESSLLSLALGDSDTNVRERTLKLLTSANFEPHFAPPFGVVRNCLKDTAETVRLAALGYLGAYGREKDLPEIEELLNDADYRVRDEAKYARLRILLRSDTEAAFNEIFNPESDIELKYLSPYIQPTIETVTTEFLLDKLNELRAERKVFVTNELIKRNALNKQQLEVLIKDKNQEVRKIAYIELANYVNTQEAEQLLKEFPKSDDDYIEFNYYLDYSALSSKQNNGKICLYQKFTFEELLEKINFYRLETTVVIRAMAKYYPESALDLIRTYLNDEFEGLESEAYQLFASSYGEISAQDMRLHKEFSKNVLATHSLEILFTYGKETDVNIARKYFKSTDAPVRFEALRIIERFGDESDLDLLFSLLKDSSEKFRLVAARGILRFAEKRKDIVPVLLDTNDLKIVALVVSNLYSKKSLLTKQFLKALLRKENAVIRKMSVSVITNRYSKEEIKNLLESYQSTPTYYYNVVNWLDKMLYAPKNLRQVFKAELKQLISAL